MKLSRQFTLAICLACTVMTSHAAIKKTSPQELKKIMVSKKFDQHAPSSYQMQPPMEEATSEMPAKMPYVDAAEFRQPSTATPTLESSSTVKITSERFINLREEASANLKAIPYIEIDRNSRLTHSIVFGIGGSDGYGFK